MKSDELRAIQAPLKEKYKEAPTAALITLKAQGRIGEGITCKIETGRAMVEAGLQKPLVERDSVFVRAICCLRPWSLAQA